MSCASPAAFMSNGIFSLGASQSLSKAAVAASSDYLIKKETGKIRLSIFLQKLLATVIVFKRKI